MEGNKSTLEKMRAEERNSRKNLIVDAAITQFAQKPFTQVGMRDIAAQAGMSAASIYRYFTDRDELFLEAMIRESRAVAAGLRRALKDGKSVSLKDLAADFVDYLLEHDAFFQMMTHFMVDGGINETSLEKFNAAEREVLNTFEEVLRKMGAQSNVRLAAHAFFASLNGILITFRNYPGRSREETRKHILRLAELITEAFQKGVIT